MGKQGRTIVFRASVETFPARLCKTRTFARTHTPCGPFGVSLRFWRQSELAETKRHLTHLDTHSHIHPKTHKRATQTVPSRMCIFIVQSAVMCLLRVPEILLHGRISPSVSFRKEKATLHNRDAPKLSLH